MGRYLSASLVAPLATPLLYCVGISTAALLDPYRRIRPERDSEA